jgi:hypothetical protein
MQLIQSALTRSKYLCGILLLAISPLAAHATNCTVAATLPKNQQQIGSGSAIAGNDGVTTVKGDQAVYVKVTNQNVLGVSYTVTIAQNTIPTNDICSYSAILLPKTSVILSGALFGEPPIGWKITVSVGDESDAGVLTYVIYSLKH